MTNLPQLLRQQLAENFRLTNLETVRVLGSKDTTRKFLVRRNPHRIGLDSERSP